MMTDNGNGSLLQYTLPYTWKLNIRPCFDKISTKLRLTLKLISSVKSLTEVSFLSMKPDRR